MKFTAALFALMAVTSVAAAPAHQKSTTVAKSGGAGKAAGGLAAALAGAEAAKKAKASKGIQGTGASSNAAAVDNSAASADNSTVSSTADASNSTADASNSTSTADASNSTSTADASNSTSTADASNSTASSATAGLSADIKQRACDMGDQSLAAGLSALMTVGIGSQAAVLTLQNATAAADFATGVTRLQQFISTAALQLQMAQGIADSGSFAQPQLALLATDQASQATAAGTLVDATTSAAALTSLGASFLDSTNNAMTGAANALADCRIPLNAVSG